MKNIHALIIGLGCLALAACSSNTSTVVVPVAQTTVAQAGGAQTPQSTQTNARRVALAAAARPCMLPSDQRGAYASAVATKSLSVEPPRAKQERVSGCASAIFNLDKNGNATNIKILNEAPQGYGYGDALMQAISGSSYNPPVSASQLYFVLSARSYNSNSSVK